MVVSIKIDQFGLKTLLRKLDPKRVGRAQTQALNKGSAHLMRVIKAESRVKSGDYKGDWLTRKRGDSHIIVNVDRGGYADLVTGNTMPTTLRGRRRGAGAAFMRKIRRENSMAIRRIMQEVIRGFVRD